MDGDFKQPPTTVEHHIQGPEGAGDKRPFIYFISGNLVGSKFPLLPGATTVGRDASCTVVVADKHVSRKHFEITVQGGSVMLADLESRNGTFVNGVKSLKHVLRDGDKIQVSASTIIKFTLQDADESHFHDQLYSMAVLDPLTDLHNRRFFLQKLDELFEQTVMGGPPLSLLMVDIDHFKAVNDRHGHPAGDTVLKHVAHTLRSTARSGDLVARYGGEEFAILMPGTDESNALLAAERMRPAIDRLDIQHEDLRLHVTASFGVATLGQDATYPNPSVFVAQADICLYSSKENGRNCVTSTSQTIEETQTFPVP